jgi:DNA-binding NtrC family response regulator
MERPIALVLDPDPAVRAAMREALALRDVAPREGGSSAEHGQGLGAFDLLVVDVDGDRSGLPPPVRDVLADPFGPPVVALTGRDAALLDLLRAGCIDVVRKPIEAGGIDAIVTRAARQAVLRREARRLRDGARAGGRQPPIVGQSDAIEVVRRELHGLAASRAPVCITGETGTGKEFIARALHDLAGDGPFVALGCKGLGEANGDLAAHFARAAGGSLFLEELPELRHELQARLLQTLGSRTTTDAEARLVVSSRRPLRQVLDEGAVLPELGRRLGGRVVDLPPLRERREDIAPLARHFVGTICEINRLPEIRLSPDAIERLERYVWPANVQELRNAMEQAVILAEDGVIRPQDLPDRVREASEPESLGRQFRDAKRDVVERFERDYLRRLLAAHAGNVTSASHKAGMLRSALQRLLRKYGLRSADFRGRRGVGPEPGPRDAEHVDS